MNQDSIRIVFSPGEPAGIGLDLCVRLAYCRYNHRAVVIVDPDVLMQRAGQMGLPVTLEMYDPENTPGAFSAGQLCVLPNTAASPVTPGEPNEENVPYVLSSLKRAVQGCIEEEFQALVTGPINKEVINAAGHDFTGHTEFLAELTGGTPVMMLAIPELRVALATTHLPLSEVSRAITPEGLERTIRTLHQALVQNFKIENPNILVCGLNPHAGEGGYFGREEIEIIEPTLDKLRQEKMTLTGPLPADTLFTPHNLEQADAVLAMYHDQGLPVLKHLGFGRAANITLGLPIIRTSVDHGTALALAGSGQEDSGSLDVAFETALNMAKNQFDEESEQEE